MKQNHRGLSHKTCRFSLFTLILLRIFLGGTVLYAQEGEALEDEAATGEAAAAETVAAETVAEDETAVADTGPPPLTRDQEILELDITTSTLSELANWCRSLGLSEGGNREALANRLREHFQLPVPAPEEAVPGESADTGQKQPKTIIIESARSTEYFTLDVVDEEYARLTGDVIVSLKDGDTVHRIKAWEILYNRSRNLLSASGGVEYVKESGDTIETFRGQSITVDMDNWSSIFLDGLSERSMSGDDTTYRFAGTVLSRSDEEATVMKKAVISNPKKENAYWSLSASKLWLLPGSDWAVLNAVLKVGEIPIFYFPAFFFPADELIFHPVLGFRSRPGTFLQTTTYILGRPQASAASSSESSITKILGNSTDMEKVREGVFLRSTGKKSRDPNTTRLSVLLDAYTNLGFYAGTEVALPKKGILNSWTFSGGVGFTRDVIPANDYVFTPYKIDGSSSWNVSKFFNLEVPFRYRMTNVGSLSQNSVTFSWSLPFYSDTFVNQDFMNRSEEMDYFRMLRQGGAPTEEDLTANVLGSYEWRLSGSANFPTTAVTPYISTLSLSSLSSFISFRTRSSTALRANTYTPNRNFFYPDRFTIYSLSASIGGTPLTLGTAQQDGAQSAETETAVPAPVQDDPLSGLGSPLLPWGTEEEQAVTNSSGAQDLSPPALNQRFDTALALPSMRFTIGYQLNPSSVSELQFQNDQANWPEVEDIRWDEVASVLTSVKTDGNLTFTLADSNNIVSNVLRFTGNVNWQDYTYFNDEAADFNTEEKRNAAIMRAYQSTYFTTSAEYTATIKPFFQNQVWGNSNIQYRLKSLIAKNAVNKVTDPDDAVWDVTYGKWDKESLEAHQVITNIQALVLNKTQTLTLTADLPPEDTALTGDATAQVWITKTTLHGKVLKPFEDDRFFEPVRFTEALQFTSRISFSQNVIYDPELKEFTSLISSLTLYHFTASFTAVHSRTYRYDPSASTGWTMSTGDPVLNPREFRMAYTQNYSSEPFWKNRVTLGFNINTSLAFDLQRYTNSVFNFSLNFSLKVFDFVDFTLGTTSTNAVVFRYFQDLPFFDLPEELPGEKNILVDLINSFRFDNETLRRNSGFKLKTFNFSLIHHLGDWTATLKWTLSPYLEQPTGALPYYKFNNEISFLIQWIPISEIKSEIGYKKDKFEFK
jgi:lipopolysaccharide assembly outer membrane protein LptD (OstA)